MTDRTFSLLISTYSYGGNGGFASQHPAVGDYIMKVYDHCREDRRISRVAKIDLVDTPITMTRNQTCVKAIEAGADFLLMIDSDMECDYGVGQGQKPFFPTSLDFCLSHWDRGPVMVGAPYGGPPPYCNTYAFQWESPRDSCPDPGFKLVRYERNHAAMMGGIQECAALATGLLLIDVRLLKMTDPMIQFRKLVESGDTVDEAERKTKPWFYYEWKDCRHAEKGSTEDVTFSRDMALWGVQTLGYNPVFLNWDAWAGHYKPFLVTKPTPITVSDVGEKMRFSVLHGRESNEQLLNLNFPAGDGVPVSVGIDPGQGSHRLKAGDGRGSGGPADRAGEVHGVAVDPGTGNGDAGPADSGGNVSYPPTLAELLCLDQRRVAPAACQGGWPLDDAAGKRGVD